MARRILTYLIIFLCSIVGCYAQPTTTTVDACDRTSPWHAELRDYYTDETLETYTPSEFFTPNGAEIPDFEQGTGVYPYMEFNGLSCMLDAFDIDFTIKHGSYSRSETLVTIWIYTEPKPDYSFLDSLEIKSGETTKDNLVSITQSCSPKQNGLRAENISVLSFRYRNGIISKYQDGLYIGSSGYNICRLGNFSVEWNQAGGALLDVKFTDYTNNAEWEEDFSDCSDVHPYPICPKPEEEVINLSFSAPTCANSDLVLEAETNLDLLKWAGPVGFTAEGGKITIPYSEAKSGCYVAYGQRDRCSPVVYEKVCIEIPDIKVKTELEYADICEAERYVWGDTVLTTSGVYVRHTTNPITGCDKAEVVKLDVHKTQIDIYETLCYGESYFFNGMRISESGRYSYTIRNESGTCDSTTTLYLDILPEIPRTVIDTSFCDGSYIELFGGRVTTNRSYTLRLPSSTGCDSTVTYNIRKRDRDERTYTKSICEGESITANGITYTPKQDTIIKNTSTNEYGCPRYETIEVKLLSKVEVEKDTSICFGETFTLQDGTTLNESGDAKFKYVTLQTGCDSIVTYHITVLPEDKVINDTVYLCETSGEERVQTEIKTEINENNCIRTIFTPIKHRLTKKVTQYKEICFNESLTVGENTYTKSGEYNDQFIAANGCDSLVTTVLTVLDKRIKIEPEQIICDNTKSGRDTTEVETTDEEDCPLYILTPILYQSSKDTVIDTTICAGFSIEVNNTIYDATGDYEIHTTASNSCDSIIHLKLTVRDLIELETFATICFEETYSTRQNTYSETGTYTERYTSTTACDTIVTIHLTKRDKIEETKPTILECEDDVNTPLKADFTDEYQEIDATTGCNITVYQPYHYEYTEYETDEITLCFEESYTDSRNITYNTPGIYTIKDTSLATNGCNHILTTTLTIKEKREEILNEERLCDEVKSGRDTVETKVNDGNECILYQRQPYLYLNPQYEEINTSICSNKSYTIEGETYTDAGTYTITTVATNGCDSIITLNLSVNEVQTIVSYDTICNDGSFSTAQKIYTETGVYTEIYTDYDKNGCDEIHEIHLHRLPELRDTLPTRTECKPHNTETQYADYVEELKSVVSTRYLCTTRIFQPVHFAFEKQTEETVKICEGETYVVDNVTYDTEGDYTILYKSTEGCDSTYLFHLEIETLDRITKDSLFICSREEIGKEELQIDTIPVPNACPYIQFTPTKNIPIYDTYIDTTVCKGITIEYNGNKYHNDGLKQIVLKATNGCDSVISLNINHIPPKETDIDIHLCYGETHKSSIKEYTRAGYYVERLSDAYGCDSVAYIRITVEPLVEKTLPSVTFCETDSVEYHGVTYTAPATHIDTLYSNTGCPIYHYTQIKTDPAIEFVEKEYTMCEGERRFIEAYTSDMTGLKYEWYPSTYLERTYKGSTYVSPLTNMDYTITVTRGKCTTQSIVHVYVQERPKINKITVDAQTKLATIEATGGNDMYYYCPTANYEGESNLVIFEKPGTYNVKVTDETGCADSTAFFYAPPVFPDIYFTPESGDEHALWQIKGLHAYEQYKVWIYDRWGKLLRTYDSNFNGWDGYYNGHPQPSTDYWYVISIDMGEIEMSGHFTLIRNP